MATLYVRVKDMQDKGLDARAIRAALEKEGVSRGDLDLLLSSASVGAASVAVAGAELRLLNAVTGALSRFFNSWLFLALILLATLAIGSIVWSIVSTLFSSKWC